MLARAAGCLAASGATAAAAAVMQGRSLGLCGHARRPAWPAAPSTARPWASRARGVRAAAAAAAAAQPRDSSNSSGSGGDGEQQPQRHLEQVLAHMRAAVRGSSPLEAAPNSCNNVRTGTGPRRTTRPASAHALPHACMRLQPRAAPAAAHRQLHARAASLLLHRPWRRAAACTWAARSPGRSSGAPTARFTRRCGCRRPARRQSMRACSGRRCSLAWNARLSAAAAVRTPPPHAACTLPRQLTGAQPPPDVQVGL